LRASALLQQHLRFFAVRKCSSCAVVKYDGGSVPTSLRATVRSERIPHPHHPPPHCSQGGDTALSVHTHGSQRLRILQLSLHLSPHPPTERLKPRQTVWVKPIEPTVSATRSTGLQGLMSAQGATRHTMQMHPSTGLQMSCQRWLPCLLSERCLRRHLPSRFYF
jgi:hypothetical protein